MSKRLAYLEKVTQEGSTEPMAWYGLAMEYKSLERLDDSLRTFESLRARWPEYVAQYLMAGGLLETLGRKVDARAWYEAGIAVARKEGDGHTLSELEGALTALES